MSVKESSIPKKCHFLVSVAGEKPQKIVFELATDVAPKTCDNFASFCQSKEPSKTYKGTQFHRIIPGFMAQGGDYQNGDGTGGEAFHGSTLIDESFALKHDAPGVLSMANKGRNTAGSQFFITLGKSQHLDGKHVVFGRVIAGMNVVEEMAKVETEKDRPTSMQKIVIVDCGAGDGSVLDDSSGSEREEKARNKHSKRRKKSSKRDRYYSSDEDSSSSVERKSKDKKYRKKSSRKRDKHRDNDSHDDDSYDSRDRSRNRKKDKKRRRDYSSDESPEERSRDHSSKKSSRKDKRHKKKKKRSRHYSDDDSHSSDDSRRDKSSKHRKDSKKRSKDTKVTPERSRTTSGMSFGKYGIVKESDFATSTKLKRSFEIWMEEVKGIPQGSSLAKWEVSNYTKEFAEDFNTATLPHEKFYDYDKWEIEDYNKKKEQSQQKKGALSDEFQYREEMMKRAEEKRRKEFNTVKTMMSKEKIEEMKSQARLKAEMVNAYRVGDEETRLKLQKKLEPERK